VSFLATCALIAFFFPRQAGLAESDVLVNALPRLQCVRDELLTGAVLFSAVFLLNEPYTCAHHRLGRILYGALVGAATMGFRYFGVYETGVCFALLAVNSVSALIDRTEERLYRLLHRLPSERKEAAE
jgi:electron transport complex protein RnfD